MVIEDFLFVGSEKSDNFDVFRELFIADFFSDFSKKFSGVSMENQFRFSLLLGDVFAVFFDQFQDIALWSVGAVVYEIRYIFKSLHSENIGVWGNRIKRNIGEYVDFFFFDSPEFHEFMSDGKIWNNEMSGCVEKFFDLAFAFFSFEKIRIYFVVIEPFSEIENMTCRWDEWIVWSKIGKIHASKNLISVFENETFFCLKNSFSLDGKNLYVGWGVLSFVCKKNDCIVRIRSFPEFRPLYGISHRCHIFGVFSSDVDDEIHNFRIT